MRYPYQVKFVMGDPLFECTKLCTSGSKGEGSRKNKHLLQTASHRDEEDRFRRHLTLQVPTPLVQNMPFTTVHPNYDRQCFSRQQGRIFRQSLPARLGSQI
ncbi:jg12368 [Pararge aegeria aegeria]|uniref:Jg12368 protein n=1 Tax=Pararge aegeria aegeria TaxID=348720 RepID=A0A8S4S6X4_9NEOP|nr:jg12368 [Pararge aegeria aegeria]